MKYLKVILLFLATGSVISCIQFDSNSIQNANNGEIQIIGHAGLGFVSFWPFNAYPSNSYQSLKEAIIEYEPDGIEVDIHMTTDGQFVLYHDEELDSKTNLTGCIEEYTYHAVIQAKYQLGFPYDWFQSETIIGLDSLIKLLKNQDEFPYLHLDVRNRSRCFTAIESELWEKNMIARLIDYLDEWEIPREKVLIISVSYQFLEEAVRLKCAYPLSLEVVGSYEEGIQWSLERNIEYLTVKPKELTIDKVADAHNNGLKVVTFGGKSKVGNKKLLELNPDVIQTNNISALKDLLD